LLENSSQNLENCIVILKKVRSNIGLYKTISIIFNLIRLSFYELEIVEISKAQIKTKLKPE
jgi:hypothetical protein